CRICEPLCGLVATLEDGRVTKLRPDPDNPLSAGFACPKGIAMVDVQNDPDRVLHPLRRTGDGSFERGSWEGAPYAIGTRPRPTMGTRQGPSLAWYSGSPGGLSST